MSINPNFLPPMKGREKDRFLVLRQNGAGIHEARTEAFREQRFQQAYDAKTVEELRDVLLSMLEHGI